MDWMLKARKSGTFGASSLGLPVIVARAELFVPICPRRHAQALCATLLAKEHAWLLVRCRRAPARATRPAL